MTLPSTWCKTTVTKGDEPSPRVLQGESVWELKPPQLCQQAKQSGMCLARVSSGRWGREVTWS